MIILLPEAKDGLINLEDNISKINLYDILKKMNQNYLSVKLPRFKIEQSLQLVETLSNVSMETIN